MNKVISPPKYVRLNNSCLRLYLNCYDELTYYRDGGNWSVSFEQEDNGKVFSRSTHSNLHNVELIEVTYEEWAKCNGSYAEGKCAEGDTLVVDYRIRRTRNETK